MVSFVEKTYLPVHIATTDNYFSMGIIFLLKELLKRSTTAKSSFQRLTNLWRPI